MISDSTIRKMTIAQRDMLIDHVNGPVELNASNLTQVRSSLLHSGLLRGHPPQSIRPRLTTLTEAGRYAVCLVLGDYADALGRAGMIEETPLQVLRRLKAIQTSKPSSICTAALPTSDRLGVRRR